MKVIYIPGDKEAQNATRITEEVDTGTQEEVGI